MYPLDYLIEFLKIFVMKFEKFNESEIQVTQREGCNVLYHSLTKYSKNELDEITIEIWDSERYWVYTIKVGVEWVKLHHILSF